MDETTLPEHWELKKLKDIGDIYSGGTPDRDNEEYFGGDIPWLRIKDVDSFYVEEAQENINKKGLENSSAQLLPKGTVIVSTRATLGEVAIAKREVATNQGFKSVYPKQADSEFVGYYLSSITEELEQLGRTTTYPEVNKTQFSNIEIPIPPLEEQKVIVQKLNSIFEKIQDITQARNEFEEIRDQLLFSIFLEMVDESDTEHLQTGDVIDASQYGISEAMNEEGRGYPILRMGNYDSKGRMDYSELKHIELSDDELDKYKLEEGDVLFNRTNSKELVGKIAIYDGELSEAVFASYLIRVHLDEDKVLPEYFVTYLNSPRGRAEIDTKSKQSVSQANINSTELRELDFELPSIPKQREIVEQTHSVRNRIDDMLSATERSDEIMTELPQSVLNDAFQGELVDYSPDSGTEVEIEGQSSLGEF